MSSPGSRGTILNGGRQEIWRGKAGFPRRMISHPRETIFAEMADIIDFANYVGRRREGQALHRLLRSLGSRLGDLSLSRIRDLPDELLLRMAEGGIEGKATLEEFVLAVDGIGATPLRELPRATIMRFLDVYLFLIDQLRFEIMVRLGWIDPLPARDIPLEDLIRSEGEALRRLRVSPGLKEGHPHFHRFQSLLDLEKEAFLRRQIPAALEQFRRRLKGGS